MLRVLFIDDNQDSVGPAMDLLVEKFGQECQCWVKPFSDAKSQIQSFRPHVVVLDIWDGQPQESASAGNDVLDEIWDQLFCPVVIYSAMPPEVRKYTHPFIRSVTKRSDTVQEVFQAIEEMRPQIEALQKGEKSIWRAFSASMKNVAPYAFEQCVSIQARTDIIARAGRRRMAALMDEPLPDDSALAAWEQYLCPPVTKDLQLGDILLATEGQSETPEWFRLILTPSCDMVGALQDKIPKVCEILVAKCCQIELGLKKAGISLGSKGKDLSREPLLSQGFANGIVPFPRLPGKIPAMAADLRSLEQIPVAELNSFLRVASIDSPFREMVAWAYLQIACRPGLPTRDVQSWSKEINNEVLGQHNGTT